MNGPTEREKKVKWNLSKGVGITTRYVYAARLKTTNPTNHVFGKAPTEMVSYVCGRNHGDQETR